MKDWRTLRNAAVVLLVCSLAAWAPPPAAAYGPVGPNGVVDLTPTVSMKHFQYWPGGARHHQPIIVPYHKIGPDGPFATDLLLVDENTANQIDCPPHMMPQLRSGLPNEAYPGFLTCDKVPAWQWLGETFKIDARSILDTTPNGTSPIITKQMIQDAEAKHRPIRPGDAVLYWSGYDDKHDLPMPDGWKLLIGPIAGTSPAWPDPDFDASDYVGSKGVRLMGTDSPSMGAFGPPRYVNKGPASAFQNPLALESHLGNFKWGAVHTEGLMNLDKIPDGSLYITLPPKHLGSPTVESRSVAITDLRVAGELLKAVKAHRVVDLSVPLSMDYPVWWPGAGVGNYMFPYHAVIPVNTYDQWTGPYWVNTHIMDAHTGTHIDPPAHFGPPNGFDFNTYNAWTKNVQRTYEARYGKIKTTDMTSDKVPAYYCLGPARVIDVQQLVGTTDPKSWPASPAIKVSDVQAHEKLYGPLGAGDVVIFHSSHDDAHFGPFVRGVEDPNTAAPLNGHAEGWPAPTPETINYVIDKGVKCIGTDGPSMGSTNPEEATMTHWAAASREVPFVEFLINVGALPPVGGFFVFLEPKYEDNHGGPGRAIGILP